METTEQKNKEKKKKKKKNGTIWHVQPDEGPVIHRGILSLLWQLQGKSLSQIGKSVPSRCVGKKKKKEKEMRHEKQKQNITTQSSTYAN